MLRLKVWTGNAKVIRRGNFDSDRLTWHDQGYDCAWVPAQAGIRCAKQRFPTMSGS